jgi:hypothetical protein
LETVVDKRNDLDVKQCRLERDLLEVDGSVLQEMSPREVRVVQTLEKVAEVEEEWRSCLPEIGIFVQQLEC